jgi:tripartite-type tricarboxylate transporter receptor subunit TctC
MSTNVKELIALAKEKPGALNYGSFGTGSMAHLAGELFKIMANVNIVHVPYKGDAPALVALLGGEIDFMFAPIITALPHVKAGTLRGIAVSKGTRSSAVPDLPPVADTLPGFEAVSWIGLLGPAGMPKDIVDRLSGEMVKMFADQAILARLQAAGAEPIGSDAEAFALLIKKERTRWEPAVKAAGLLHTQ